MNSIDPAPHQTVYDALYQALAPFRANGARGAGEPSLIPIRMRDEEGAGTGRR